MKKEQWAELFASSEARAFSGAPLRITDDGIWLPTPVDVIESALDALDSLRIWDRIGHAPAVLDAGMGDGRLVAWLASRGAHVRALGLETDPTLYRLACANLSDLGISNARMSSGSFLDPTAYGSLGLEPSEIDCVFHYPDGNEQALAAFMRGHGRSGAYCIFLTPDVSLRFEGLVLETQLTVARSFRLYVYRVGNLTSAVGIC